MLQYFFRQFPRVFKRDVLNLIAQFPLVLIKLLKHESVTCALFIRNLEERIGRICPREAVELRLVAWGVRFVHQIVVFDGGLVFVLLYALDCLGRLLVL